MVASPDSRVSEPTPEESDDPALNLPKLAISTAAALFLLMGAAALIGHFFRTPLVEVSGWFVETLGGPGIAVGFFLPDAFTIPLPNDVFSTLGLAGGMNFWVVVFWGTLGSWVGGSVGYWIGRLLRRTRLVRRILLGRGARVEKLLARHGATGVAVAAITPLPYSIFCWAAGAGRLPFGRFFLVSLLRVVRVAGYLYLIQAGLF